MMMTWGVLRGVHYGGSPIRMNSTKGFVWGFVLGVSQNYSGKCVSEGGYFGGYPCGGNCLEGPFFMASEQVWLSGHSQPYSGRGGETEIV